jgi:hypothetical protein
MRTHQVLVFPSDKNMGLTVIDQDWYIDAAEKHLSNSKFYSKCESVDLDAIRNRLRAICKKCFDLEVKVPESDSDLGRMIYPWIKKADWISSKRVPVFYGLPKLHKNPVALRPIVPSINTISTDASIICDRIFKLALDALRRKVGDNFPILESSLELVRSLEQFKIEHTRLGDGTKPVYLVTFDVCSMYTNIDIEEGLQCLKEILEKSGILDQNQIAVTIDLWDFVLRHNFFSFGDTLYHQVSGTAMGTNGAPSFANLFMLFFEMKFILNRNFAYSNAFLKFYRRYIDDAFVVWAGPRFGLEAFLAKIGKNWSKSISIESTISDREVNYLDISIMYNGSESLAMKPYDKPMNAHCYTSPASFVPYNAKYGWIYGETMRLCRNSTYAEDFNEAIQAFKLHLENRKYDDEITVKQTALIRHDDRQTILANVAKPAQPVRVYFSNTVLRKTIMHHFDEFLEDFFKRTGVKQSTFQKVAFKGRSLSRSTSAVNRRIMAQRYASMHLRKDQPAATSLRDPRKHI